MIWHDASRQKVLHAILPGSIFSKEPTVLTVMGALSAERSAGQIPCRSCSAQLVFKKLATPERVLVENLHPTAGVGH